MPLRKSGQGGSCLSGFGSLGCALSFRKVPWTTFIRVGFGFLPAAICFHKPAVFLWAFHTNHDTLDHVRWAIKPFLNRFRRTKDEKQERAEDQETSKEWQ
jgi:hypothetical protein